MSSRTMSPAFLASQLGTEETERVRIALAIKKHKGNIMQAWKLDLSEYSERTLKRWIRKFDLFELAAAERKNARKAKKVERALILARGNAANPNS